MKALNALFFLLLLFVAQPGIAQIKLDFGDDQYKPVRGQTGKDVVWIATNDDLVTKMLKTAQVGPSDLLYDLGAGDGAIAIAAAKDFGARAIGIEYNPKLAALAQRNAERAGVADKVKIISGDLFKEDFSKASVVTLYLLPELNLQLRPILLKMKPGTRIVSNTFDMVDWEPDVEIDQPGKAFFWIVPADVAGVWALEHFDPQLKASLSLSQRFQHIGGSLTIGDKTQPLLNPRLTGDQLQFSYIDQDNLLRVVHATINGSTMKGGSKGAITQIDFSGVRR
ncbi:methyltransferase domain-containing protein [Sheuella amnicola]|uniref:methyltransferase domain-containing protein n=1 Tax=Sheuella amnicola TaxID=2707330 RepID=UPI0019455329|nr:methyltransferase domain-containing protein [Sheuella amnicola]